jgi:hypothetical protein
VEWIKSKFRDIQQVRQMAERVFLFGELSIARQLLGITVRGRGRPWPDNCAEPAQLLPTLEQLVGDRKSGWRLRQIGRLSEEGLDSSIDELQRHGKEATLPNIVQLFRMNERWTAIGRGARTRHAVGPDCCAGECVNSQSVALAGPRAPAQLVEWWDNTVRRPGQGNNADRGYFVSHTERDTSVSSKSRGGVIDAVDQKIGEQASFVANLDAKVGINYGAGRGKKEPQTGFFSGRSRQPIDCPRAIDYGDENPSPEKVTPQQVTFSSRRSAIPTPAAAAARHR